MQKYQACHSCADFFIRASSGAFAEELSRLIVNLDGKLQDEIHKRTNDMFERIEEKVEGSINIGQREVFIPEWQKLWKKQSSQTTWVTLHG